MRLLVVTNCQAQVTLKVVAAGAPAEPRGPGKGVMAACPSGSQARASQPSASPCLCCRQSCLAPRAKLHTLTHTAPPGWPLWLGLCSPKVIKRPRGSASGQLPGLTCSCIRALFAPVLLPPSPSSTGPKPSPSCCPTGLKTQGCRGEARSFHRALVPRLLQTTPRILLQLPEQQTTRSFLTVRAGRDRFQVITRKFWKRTHIH